MSDKKKPGEGERVAAGVIVGVLVASLALILLAGCAVLVRWILMAGGLL